VVLLIDEAQNLENPVLESLRLLSNIETPKRKLLQLILLGQLELEEKLRLPEMKAFRQRISVRYRLRPLDASQIDQYIAHRVKIAGCKRGINLFKAEALSLISEYTSGIPRVINGLCENALLIGFASGKDIIGEEEVHEAAADLVLNRRVTPRRTPDAIRQKPLLPHVRTSRSEKRARRWPFYGAISFGFAALAYATPLFEFTIPKIDHFTQETRARFKSPLQEETIPPPPSKVKEPPPELVGTLVPPEPQPPVEKKGGGKKWEEVLVKEHDTVSKIAWVFYGSSHSYVLGLIHMANPDIEFLDLIQTGRKMVLPYLRTESMIFKKDDGSYSIYIAATNNLNLAKSWQKQLAPFGVEANIIPVKINQRNKIYKLQGDHFPTALPALEKLKEIVPLQLMTKSMEEKNE
jgi:hypothetical protein